MPISAKFTADFSTFKAAVDSAEVTLRGFDASAGKVSSSLSRMTDSFSGRKLIQEATLTAKAIENVGGVGKLTESELKRVGLLVDDAALKLKAFGQDVPPAFKQISDASAKLKSEQEGLAGQFLNVKNAVSGFLALGAVSFFKDFAAGVADSADKLTKLSDKTGVGIESLQRLEAVGDASGNSLDELTGAISKMQVRLAGGDASAIGALNQLHISLTALRAQSPDQQFYTIARGVAAIEDPAQRAKVAVDLFGRTGVEILPSLRAEMVKVGESAHVMSEGVVKSVDDISDYWHQQFKNLKNDAVNFFDFMLVGWARNAAAAKKSADEAFKNQIPANPIGSRISLPTTDPFAIQAALDQSQPIQKTIEKIQAEVEAQKRMNLQLEAATKYWGMVNSTAERGLRASSADVVETMGTTIDLSDALEGLTGTWNEFHNGLSVTGQELSTVTIPMFSKLGDNVVPKATAQIQAAADAFLGFGDAVTKALSSLPETFERAFVGGGGIGGALKSIAVQLGSDFAKTLNDSITKNLENKAWGGSGSIVNAKSIGAAGVLGGVAGVGTAASGGTAKQAIGAAGLSGVSVGAGVLAQGGVPAIGSAIALGAATAGIGIAAVGAYYGLKKLFTVSAESKINPQREAFVRMAGGLGELSEKSVAATGSLKLVQDLLGAKNADQYKAAVDNINTAFEEFTKKLDDAHTALGTLTDRFKTVYQITPELQAGLDKAFNAQNVDDYNAALAAITGTLDAQDAKLQHQNELIAKYGLNAQNAGLAFKQTLSDKTAAGLISDFEDLAEIFPDLNQVIGTGMSEAIAKAAGNGDDLAAALAGASDITGGLGGKIEEFVLQAEKSGVEVPESMRKVIQTAIDAGQLFEENGDKITDMSQTGLKFGETMQKVTKDLQGAIERLADIIDKKIGGAFTNAANTAIDQLGRIPRDFDPHVRVGLDAGGDNVIRAAQGFSGIVRKPTLFLAGEGGSPEGVNIGRVLPFKPRASAPSVDTSGMEDRLRSIERLLAAQPTVIARAMRDEVQKVVR